MTYACRIDANQPAMVKSLRQLGVYVEPKLARLGGGIPDLLCCHHGRWFVVEVKDGSKPPSEQKLTEAEKVWHCEAKAIGGGNVLIWRSVDDAVGWLERVMKGLTPSGPAVKG